MIEHRNSVADRVRATTSGLAAMTLALTLVGCTTQSGEGVMSTTPTAAAPTDRDEPRFLIDCVDDGLGEVVTFARLEEAWASTDYLRLHACTAYPATGEPIELTPPEELVAETAAADLPGEDLVSLFALALATCVRVTPDSEPGIADVPTSILRAALELCPEAPHAGLLDAELQTRGPQ
ncbi:hypothetical protein [Agromyces neolithicus]|uniref:Lipoprotein n=1 Tax=Agromyces neolithicus TaxID=269420 RepID=A0ABP4YQS8_9MICO